MGLSCLEDHILVCLWVQTLQQDLICEAVTLSKVSKNIRSPLSNFDVFINNKFLLIHLILCLHSHESLEFRKKGLINLLAHAQHLCLLEILLEIPVFSILNFNAIDRKLILRGKIIFLVVSGIRRLLHTDSSLRDCFKDNVHQFDVQRRHQELELGWFLFFLIFFFLLTKNFFSKHIPHGRVLDSDDRHKHSCKCRRSIIVVPPIPQFLCICIIPIWSDFCDSSGHIELTDEDCVENQAQVRQPNTDVD